MLIKRLRLIISVLILLAFLFFMFAPGWGAERVLHCKPIILKGRIAMVWPEGRFIRVNWEEESADGKGEVFELEFLSSEVLAYNFYKYRQSLTEIRLLNRICNLNSGAHLLLGPPELFDP